MNFRPSTRLILLGLLIASLAVLAAGCGRDDTSTASAGSNTDTGGSTTTEKLSGKVEADGSSTVGPLTTRAAELYREQQPDVNVTVGTSGTGGGFERFCAGETDLSDASRPIKEDPADKEASVCKEAGIDYTEFKVAIDALTVVVNSENDWATCLTLDQLKKIWEPGSKESTTGTRSTRASPTRSWSSPGPARTRARSTTSRVRSTAKRVRAARTTPRARTTT